MWEKVFDLAGSSMPRNWRNLVFKLSLPILRPSFRAYNTNQCIKKILNNLGFHWRLCSLCFIHRIYIMFDIKPHGDKYKVKLCKWFWILPLIQRREEYSIVMSLPCPSRQSLSLFIGSLHWLSRSPIPRKQGNVLDEILPCPSPANGEPSAEPCPPV